MVRHLNQKLVLDVIRRQEPISRAQISKQLSLSRSTVSQIVDCLLEDNMVFEVGVQSNELKTCGRPGQMLRFNPLFSYIVGMELRRDDATVCIADMRGRPIAIKTYAPVRDAQEVYEVLSRALEASGIEEKRVARLSVSVPGVVNLEGKVIRASRLKWRNYDLPGQFKIHSSIPIYVNNDVNLELIGEKRFGIGCDHENIVYIHLGTGVGSAVMSDGKMVLGSAFTAGEIQFFSFKAGQKETYTPLEKLIALNSFSGYPGGFSGLIQGYTQGDQECCPVIEDFIHTLATTIAFIVSLLNPSLVIIGGRMSADMSDILDDIRDEVEQITPYKAEIQLSKLEKESCLLGAVAYALDQIDQE